MRLYTLQGEHLTVDCQEHGQHIIATGYIDCDTKEGKHLLDNFSDRIGKEPRFLNFHVYPKTGMPGESITVPVTEEPVEIGNPLEEVN